MANSAIHQNSVFHVGDTIDVHYRLIEKEKVAGKTKREVKEEVRERIQIFEGLVIAIKGEGDNKSFIVRKSATGGIGIERIFPLVSPWIKKITIKKQGLVKHAKLYYLRNIISKKAERLKEKTQKAPNTNNSNHIKKHMSKNKIITANNNDQVISDGKQKKDKKILNE